jgi:hypothetical protein
MDKVRHFGKYSQVPIFAYILKARLTGHVARTSEMRNAYKILVGIPERETTRKI